MSDNTIQTSLVSTELVRKKHQQTETTAKNFIELVDGAYKIKQTEEKTLGSQF